MPSVRWPDRSVAWLIAALVTFASDAVSATAQRTFVSSSGSDANVCSLAQPCRSFAAAIAKTSANGEVIVLDSAGYGPVTVTQSVTITSPAGVYAGITVTSGEGVTVNGTGIDVTLRGLTINSQGGSIGIHFVDGATLVVERCEISGFSAAGIEQELAGSMLVRDSLIKGAAGSGIFTAANATIERVAIVGTAFGLDAENGAEVSARDTSVSGASASGVYATSLGPRTTVTLDTMTITDCNIGVLVFAGLVPTAAVFVDAVRSSISQNHNDGIRSSATDGTALVHVTDSLVSLNASAGLSTTFGGEITASGSTIVNNGNYGLNSVNGGIFTMQNNQVRDNAPTNIIGTVNPLGFN
jgi:hypothetical protein